MLTCESLDYTLLSPFELTYFRNSFADRDMLALYSGGGIGHKAFRAHLRQFREDYEAAFGTGPADDDYEEAVVSGQEESDEQPDADSDGNESGSDDDGRSVNNDDDEGSGSDSDGEETDDEEDWEDIEEMEENDEMHSEEAGLGYDRL
jgi:hypothetical protein